MAFHQIHASGHCSMEEVFGAIEEIGPGKVLPVHTEHPEIFAERLSRERTLWIDDLPYKFKA